MKIFVDAFAWIEYFKGNERGSAAAKYIESSRYELFTLLENLAELSVYYHRNKLEFNDDFSFILSRSRVTQPNQEDAIQAGKTSAEKRKTMKNWGLVDSLLLTTAKRYKAKILTGDQHFKDIKEAILI
ncbi:MAG: PIN domain-containing protein [Candidatus Altiarchaeota archaeon]